MDTWNSEWVTENSSVDDISQFYTLYNSIEENNDSPNISRDDSIESYGDDQPERNDTIIKPTFKSVLQAKKRLHAFSALKKLRKATSREDKIEEEKLDKVSSKKPKKALYPDDKAKAVIKEIEEIKRMEGKNMRPLPEYAFVDLPKPEMIIAASAVKSVSIKEAIRARSRSLSSEREYFKKREIKCRNYRRKSVSPEDYIRKKSPVKKITYPKSWSEYKEQNLTLAKDDDLKAKLLPKQKFTQHELVNRMINFDTPSPILEAFKSMTIDDQIEIIPPVFMRVTRAKPPLVYSINFNKNKESYMSRKQLFNIISRDRREVIEKLFSSTPRSQANVKNMQSRQWYSKTWKKAGDAECKILEKSVGLSFLQTYSDEEEENDNEEIVICSSTKQNGIKSAALEKKTKVETFEKDKPQAKVIPRKETLEKIEFLPEERTKSKPQIEKAEKPKDPTSAPTEKIGKDKSQNKTGEKTKSHEEHSAKAEPKLEKTEKDKQLVERSPKVPSSKKLDASISHDRDEVKKMEVPKVPSSKKLDASISHDRDEVKKMEKLTPEKKPTELKKWQRDELNETRRAIKELEEELERRKAIKIEEELKEEKKAKKKKQKKVKKKQEVVETEEEDDAVKKKKKKKKIKAKKTIQEDEDDVGSDDGKRKKKKNKKERYKTEKFRKKKEKNKKEIKAKKKDEDLDNDNLKDESKKKKKPSIDDTPSSNDKNKSTEIIKTKKKKRENRDEVEKEEIADEKEINIPVLEETKKHIKEKEKNKDSNENNARSRRKKNRWDHFDIESYTSENEKYEKSESSKFIDPPEIQLVNKSKQVEVKESSKKVYKTESTYKEKSTVNEKESKHHDEQDKRKRDKEINKHEKGSKRSKDESERVHVSGKTKKDLEETKISDVEDVAKLKKYDEQSKKHSYKDKPKEDVDKVKKSGEKPEEKDRRNVDSKGIKASSNVDSNGIKASKDRRSSEKSEKSDSQRKRDDSRDRHRNEKSEKHQKEKRSEDLYDKQDKVNIKEEPDWENLRSKRKRHRDSDSKDSNKEVVEEMYIPEEFEAFPLEKELFNPEKDGDRSQSRKSNEAKITREFGTPDTNEYRENWEKDPFPIWESEDDAPQKPREKLNNSWESDEETFERGHRAAEGSNPFAKTFDLEIPLNIKPFKRRETINPDIELQLLKRESITLSEERRRLEIEKQRVKELELKVIREVENKALEDQYKSKRRRSTEEKGSRSHDRERQGRWDKKEAQPKKTTKAEVVDLSEIKADKSDDDCCIISVSSPAPTNNTVAVLENEYEEFMKAVTSSATPKRKLMQGKSKKLESISSASSFMSISDTDSCGSESFHSKRNMKKNNPMDLVIAPKHTALKLTETARIDSPAKPTMISPKDVALIPMPAPIEVIPAPVPSPQIDVEKIPKPLINLSLSANITLDIVSKLASPALNSPSAKSMEFLDSPVANFDAAKLAMSSIGTPPSVKSLELLNSPVVAPVVTQSPVIQDLQEKTAPSKPEAIVSFASPLTDASLDSILFDERPATKESQRLNKPFMFTSMVIPSKKLLLDNSNLNLDDSDGEAKKSAMAMRSLEEIKKENLVDNTRTVVEKQPKQETQSTHVHSEKPKESESSSHVKAEKSSVTEEKRREKPRSSSPTGKKHDSSRKSSKDTVKREVSPKRSSHGKREPSPRRRTRESSPKRRRSSPKRHVSPRRKSPVRRRSSPAKRKHSPKRSISPRYRRRSNSPRRRSPPRRSKSPKLRASSPKRIRSKSPDKPKPVFPPYKPPEAPPPLPNRLPSPVAITSPLEGLKRSVADSTISDDLLPQPSIHMDDYTESPISRFYDRNSKAAESPKRVSLDDRITQVLGLQNVEPQPIPTTFANYNYVNSTQVSHTQYSQQFVPVPKQENEMPHVQKPAVKAPVQQSKSNFVQVGNMVRIVPTENIPIPSPVKVRPKNIEPPAPSVLPPVPSVLPPVKAPVPKVEKSQIVQVGNIFQIVPADMSPEPPLPPVPKAEPEPRAEPEPPSPETPVIVIQEKQSAEAAMKSKIAELRAEREKRREDRERRRKEKEKRRKEKDKKKQIKLKQRTENMIKKALQLEVEGGIEDDDDLFLNDTPTQWPPLPLVVSSVAKEVGRSILRGGHSKNDSLRDRRKVVQFADGVRPGEGTSPSGGEELSSPPPASKKLPKEKRYKKTKFLKKNQKKKVKVKVIKKRLETEESDEEDNLPPPSPPPGSPPPHIFPPRIKTHTINNVHPYLSNVPIQPSHNLQVYRSPLNIIMHHHHGPPPPPGPPHHHHGPPLPPPGPPHHHHGPPPPPGPPHFHHGPPPPGPPHHHHGPPPPPHGPPGSTRRPLRPPPPYPGSRWHHGPPPPYHH